MMLATGQVFVMSVWVGQCCGYVGFIYPSPQDQNLTFNYIDVVYFTWTSNIAEPWMNLWCAHNSSVLQSHNYRESYPQCYTAHPRATGHRTKILNRADMC